MRIAGRLKGEADVAGECRSVRRRGRSRVMSLAAMCALVLTVGACSDDASEGGEGAGGPGAAGGPAGPLSSDPNAADPANAVKDAAGPASDFSGKPSGIHRLTRDELITTLTDLTGTAPTRVDFPAEVRSAHSPLMTTGLALIAAEVERFSTITSTFAKTVAPALLSKSGCAKTGAEQQGCLTAWASTFGERALRRPLRSNEAESLKSIFLAATGVAAVDVELVQSALTAFFFSPSFLYRTEIGTPIAGRPTVRALSNEEITSKLSYLATLGPPDAELLAAGSAGKLADAAERTRQYVRLSSTPAGAHAQAVMILEWLGSNESEFAKKNQKYRDGLAAGTEVGLRASAEQYITKVLTSGDNATVASLFTTDSYLKDPMVTQLTQVGKGGGVPTGDDTATPRLGLLLHPHVVTAHTKESGASPFGIGAFLREAVLCEPLAPPPAGVTAMTRNDAAPGLSLREEHEYRTSAGPSCIGCHTQFAPLGYSYMAFDPIGRWIKQDPSGKPWVLTGTTPLYRGEKLAFNSPNELTKNLAKEPQVYGCFAQVALQWVRGRKLTREDEFLLNRIDRFAKSNSANVPKLMQTIVDDSSFLTAVASR